MPMRRLLHLLNLGLVLLLIGGSLRAFPHLPARIPRHFGLGGTADAYWDGTLVHWLLIPGIALIIVGLVYGVVCLIGSAATSFTVSSPEQYNALAPSQQRAVARSIQSFLYGTATAMLILFSAAQWGTYRVATSATTTLPGSVRVLTVGIPVVLVVAMGVLAWWLPRRVWRLVNNS